MMLRARSLTSTPPQIRTQSRLLSLGVLQSTISNLCIQFLRCVCGVACTCLSIETRRGGWEPSSVALHCVEMRRGLSWTWNSIPTRLPGIPGTCGAPGYMWAWGNGGFGSSSLTFPASILTHTATSLARAWASLNPFSKCVHFPGVCRREPTQCQVYSSRIWAHLDYNQSCWILVSGLLKMRLSLGAHPETTRCGF